MKNKNKELQKTELDHKMNPYINSLNPNIACSKINYLRH